MPRMPMRVSREGRASMRCRHALSLLRRVEDALLAMDDQAHAW